MPLAKDFHVTFSGGGALIRHRVAFFGEEEAASLLKTLEAKGVQIIRKKPGAKRIVRHPLFFK